MNLRPTAPALLTDESLLERLPALGALLDEMERGTIPLSPRQYRKASREAVRLLGSFTSHARARAACARSDALRQLLQNELMAQADARGELRWAFDLSLRFGALATRRGKA